MGDFDCCVNGEHERGKTYTIITAHEDTIDYKIGYHHGATGRFPLPNQTDNYVDGFVAGLIVRHGELK